MEANTSSGLGRGLEPDALNLDLCEPLLSRNFDQILN
jgi:hypothetical protein